MTREELDKLYWEEFDVSKYENSDMEQKIISYKLTTD
ncbi:hypothetical protein LCGC14_2052730 [marine sediment metagenome]|uniref:Uncharacterized protein n=1 Tax=marine sediment metagenome TaxID=412755 RepID=A0A0F9FAY7_9ZZZZ